MTFLERVRERAAAAPRTIVLPEGEDERTREAARRLAAERLVRPVLLVGGDRADTVPPVDGVTILTPATDTRGEALAELLHQRRRHRGMTLEEAQRLVVQPILFGALLVAAGQADGSVAGAVHTTGAVLRAALWAVGTAPDIDTVSSSFYMTPRSAGGEERVLTFTDPAVVPDPSPRQLAEIALAAADARAKVVGDEPRVAFLSYSTRGSAEGPLVERVREALAIFQERAPEIPADGELQADAAVVHAIGQRKAPGSEVAGRANVLVFPDLDAGNIAYKLVERLGGAGATGPIIQGLRRPCNDLSRGASVDDIINVACITALMAG